MLPSDAFTREAFSDYLKDCRSLVLDEIRRIIPNDGRYGEVLYDLMFEYPLREAKGLRPALSIATCRALGGKIDSVLRSATVLELYHNAFLIHDDIEDESELRRGSATLHRQHGVPVAVNVGDAMLGLSLQPLLDNTQQIGLGPALRILECVARMTRESVEGQAVELDWVRRGSWHLSDADYVDMVEKKTGWYSFITPVKVGAIAAGADEKRSDELVAWSRPLAIAFQIRDDLLNLDGDVEAYGKEIGGDLWEGKRTLMVLHMMRCATEPERREVARILDLSRPPALPVDGATTTDSSQLLARLVASGDLSPSGLRKLEDAGVLDPGHADFRTLAEVEFLMDRIRHYGSLDYAADVAGRFAQDARERFESLCDWLPLSVHRNVLGSLVDYVQDRSE